MAVFGMCCVDLNNNVKKNYKTVIDIQQLLKIWKMRHLTLEGKIVIFKTMAISKVVLNHS